MALVSRICAGDDAAFERVVRETSGRLLAVAVRFLRDPEDARDAVQDAFLSAYRNLGSFDGASRLSTWLHRIVVNASLMKLRSRSRAKETPIDDLLPRFLDDGHQADPGQPWRELPDDALAREERRALVRNAIDRLPESYRQVVLLRDIEGLDTRETAAALGLVENAVKLRLHRARQALRSMLDPHFAKGGPS